MYNWFSVLFAECKKISHTACLDKAKMLPCCDTSPVSPTGNEEEKKTGEKPQTSGSQEKPPQEPQVPEPQKDSPKEAQPEAPEVKKESEDNSRAPTAMAEAPNERKQDEQLEDKKTETKAEKEQQPEGDKQPEESKGSEVKPEDGKELEETKQPEVAKDPPETPVDEDAEREERRELAIQELIDTERVYYGDLLVVVSIYMDPLQNNAVYSKMITQQEFRDIFSNFATFPPLHSDLLRFVQHSCLQTKGKIIIYSSLLIQSTVSRECKHCRFVPPVCELFPDVRNVLRKHG